MLVDLQDGAVETAGIIAVCKWQRGWWFGRKRYLFSVETAEEMWDFEYATASERDSMYNKLMRASGNSYTDSPQRFGGIGTPR